MPGQGRLGDKANVPLDSHGCPACPHPAAGPAIQGSPDVNVNGRPALRVDDPGIHAACCGSNTWTATKGSTTVFVNGKAAHRMGDQNRHCGGMGQLVEGSPNVVVGEISNADGGSVAGNHSIRASRGSPGSNTTGSARTVSGGTASDTRVDERRETTNPSTFIMLSLVDQDGQPFGGQFYRVTAPDGAIQEGTLDEQGKARVDGIAAGTCHITFPNLAAAEWGPA